MDDLNLKDILLPVQPNGIYRETDYFCWCPYLIREVDKQFHDSKRVYMVYSRWPKTLGHGGWLTGSEVALAVSDCPQGTFQHRKVIIKGRGSGFWDECMAHNPRIEKFDDCYYMYYISSRRGESFGHIRDSQRVGVAVAHHIEGPYERFDKPLIEPSPPLYNITTNPTVTRMPDGRYLFIIKGDIKTKQPHEKMPQRIQAIGIADSPLGPVHILPNPAICDIDTEDACLWYDAIRQRYYAIFHAHTYIGLITSEDGIHWKRSSNYHVTDKRIAMADGSFLIPERLERPSVYFEDGHPRMLCLGAANGDDWYNLLVPLKF